MPKVMEIIEKEPRGKATTHISTVMIRLVYHPLTTMMILIR